MFPLQVLPSGPFPCAWAELGGEDTRVRRFLFPPSPDPSLANIPGLQYSVEVRHFVCAGWSAGLGWERIETQAAWSGKTNTTKRSTS